MSVADIDRILSGKSDSNRAEIAATMGQKLDGEMSSFDRGLAEEIVRRLAEDAAEIVRLSLAQSVRNSAFLPKDIGKTIAYDIESVATPFLEVTQIFDAEELCEIARNVSQGCKAAIASREGLEASVAWVLSECGDLVVAKTLAANDSAELRTETLINLVRNFDGEESLFEIMAKRDQLPMPIAQVLISRVSDAARQALIQRHNISESIANPLIEESRLRSILSISERANPLDLMAMMRDIKQEGRLVPAALIWALRADGIRFFEAACALLAGWPLSQAKVIIREGKTEDLRQLFAKCKIPPALWSDITFELDRIVKSTGGNENASSATNARH